MTTYEQLVPGRLRFAEPNPPNAPYPDNWLGMADDVEGATKWLQVGGITDAGARRLALRADRTYVSGSLGVGTPNPATALHLPERGLQIGTSPTASDNFHWASDVQGGPRALRLYGGNYGSGTHLLTVTPAGSLGIGTTAPRARLDLGGGALRWGSSAANAASIELGAPDNATPGVGTPFIDFHFLGLAQDFNTRIINDADGRLSLVAATLRATGSATVAGSLGVGTADPQERLQLGSRLAFHDGGHTVVAFGWSPAGNKTLAAGFPAEIRWAPAEGLLRLGVDIATRSPGDAPAIPATLAIKGADVGIGTAAPSHRFHVVAPDAVGLFESSGAQAYLRLSTAEGLNNRVELANRPGGRLSLWVADAGDALNVLKNGNVGIGTATPGARLHVSGNDAVLNLEGTDHAYIQWFPDGFGGGRKAWTGFGAAADNNFTLANEIAGGHIVLRTTDGNVGIGLANPQARLAVAGRSATVGVETAEVVRLLRPGVAQVKNANSAGFFLGAFEAGIAGRARLDVRLSGVPAAGNAWGESPDVTVLSLLGSGDVGVGTAAPAARLSVVARGANEIAGTAQSATLRTSAGSLGPAAGAELSLASIGFHSGNSTSLGIRAYRAAAGADWTTAAVGLGIDVDNTVRVNGSGLWLHANGSVGIGTVAPSQRLHVNGGAIVGGIVLGGDVPGVVDYPYEYETVGVANASMNLRLQSPNAIVFHTAGTPRLTIDKGGHVSITPPPGGSATLTVGAGADGVLRVRRIDGKSWQNDNDDPLYLNWNNGQAVVVGNPQRVGGLTVYGDVTIDRSPADDATRANARLSLTNRGPGGQAVTWSLYTAAVGGGWGVTPNAFEIWEYPATNSRFQIRQGGNTILAPAGGNVGIGIADPQAKLHVAGDIRMGAANTLSAPGRLHIAGDELLYLLNRSGVVIGKEWGGNGNLSVQGDVFLPGVIRGDVRIEGRLGTYGYSPVPYHDGWGGGIHTFDVEAEATVWTRNLDVDNAAFISRAANTVWFFKTASYGSDARLKENIAPLRDVLPKLAAIRGVSFERANPDGPAPSAPRPREIGVVAQEVEAVFPELVTTHGDQEYRGVDYGGLTGVLLEAIKELHAQMNVEVGALRRRLAALEPGQHHADAGAA